jgi:hypothetical protein
MTSDDVSSLIAIELRNYHYEAPAPDTTMGAPWAETKVMGQVDKLRDSLITPYLQQFVLIDTYEQMSSHEHQIVQYWVVAETEEYCEFYDPDSGEFGLAEPPGPGAIPRTAGVRGDLVGVFCAM